ncbi:MAG: hypothetical protein HQK50_06010 [Oligoflexia bacterium]|nr:hypothetical protein [Oligoflexia bacterium]MBF0365105.1 hypothetical protein [Oligoflexia bacterium]
MKLFHLFTFTLLLLLLMNLGIAKEKITKSDKSDDNSRVNVKTVIKYKKHTEVDLSGTIVKGKARNPEVFYIFQRKRSGSRAFVNTPNNLSHHKVKTSELVKGGIGE